MTRKIIFIEAEKKIVRKKELILEFLLIIPLWGESFDHWQIFIQGSKAQASFPIRRSLLKVLRYRETYGLTENFFQASK